MGKTTCAAALGIAAAKAGSRVLVASTDPAPSLGDALHQRLSASPRRVPLRRGHLFAAELDAARSLKRWIDERRSALEQIALQGTWLDADDVARLLRLTLPGIDELAALFEIARLASGRRFDLIVVDTAPTGHTLRMLSLPRTLAATAELFDQMREKQRAIEGMLRGAWSPGTEDAVISQLASTAADLSSLLRDRARTRITWVTLPEALALAETEDAIRALQASGMAVDLLIANRLTPPPERPCGHCDARRVAERRILQRLPSGIERRYVLGRDREPRGVRQLSAIGSELQAEAALAAAPRRARRWVASLDGPSVSPWTLVSDRTRLVLLGGKGGVGKTTCATALAASLAYEWPGRAVLLISVDPAHSLSDVLGVPVTDNWRALAGGPPNLRVRELNAALVLRELQARLAHEVERLVDPHDRSVVRSLIELAPPGLDELAAVLRISDTVLGTPAQAQLVVIDTAPTGHALRLLEMPALIQEWTRALMSILLKYRAVVPLGEAGAALLELSQAIGRLKRLLSDRVQTSFIPVSRPEALPRLETLRLLRQLHRLGLHAPFVIVNSVGRGSCRRCARDGRAQQIELSRIGGDARATGYRTIVTPTQVPPPHGLAALRRWSTRWIEPVFRTARSSATLRYHRSR